MNDLKWTWALAVAALAAVGFSAAKALQDRADPTWTATEKLLRRDFRSMEKDSAALDAFFERCHGRRFSSGSARAAMGPDKLPTVELRKFEACAEAVFKEKRIVFAAVSGVGASALARATARFVVQKPSNLIETACAPLFDLELHRELIGSSEGKKFEPGSLLRLWAEAKRRPDEKFALLVQDIDKVNPEALFGPMLWEKLADPKTRALVGGELIEVPSNFYLISVAHLGVSAKNELSLEHFRRLGPQFVIEPTADELVLYLQNKLSEETQEAKTDEKSKNQLAALRDTASLQRFVYFYQKANQKLIEKYGPSYQVGWTSARKFFAPDGLEGLRQLFIAHANALKPAEAFSSADFEAIDYGLRTGGLEMGSNFFGRARTWLIERGFFTEFTMISLTALVTAAVGWFVFRQRRKLLADFDRRVHDLMEAFEKQRTTAEDARRVLDSIKKEVDTLVYARKLSHSEAVYFYSFIDDKARRVEAARASGEVLEQLIAAFLEDGVLSESEHQKLIQFLESVRHRVPLADFERFRAKVDAIHQKFRGSV